MIAIFAALSAALAVGAGAFGAHGASSPDAAEWLKTGGLYQLIHAVAALTNMSFARGPAVLLLVGGATFEVTLYAMALGAPRCLGAITPIGGTLDRKSVVVGTSVSVSVDLGGRLYIT